MIVGCDRVAANGDVANKVGTYAHALAARAAGHPVRRRRARPRRSTRAPRAATRSRSRSATPTRCADGGRQLATLPGRAVRNPAFDVTPAELVTALVTERGVAARRRRRLARRAAGAAEGRAVASRTPRDVAIEERPGPGGRPRRGRLRGRGLRRLRLRRARLVGRAARCRSSSATSSWAAWSPPGRASAAAGSPVRRRASSIHHHAPCGECRRCRRGHETLCEALPRLGARSRRVRRARARTGGADRRAARRSATSTPSARSSSSRWPACCARWTAPGCGRGQPARRGRRDERPAGDRRRARARGRRRLGPRAAPRADGARAGARRRAPRQRARRRRARLHASAEAAIADGFAARRARRRAVPLRAALPRRPARRSTAWRSTSGEVDVCASYSAGPADMRAALELIASGAHRPGAARHAPPAARADRRGAGARAQRRGAQGAGPCPRHEMRPGGRCSARPDRPVMDRPFSTCPRSVSNSPGWR